MSQAEAPGLPVPVVRWMLRGDVAAVLAIERGGCAPAWGPAELGAALRAAGAVALVAELEGRVAGFLLYAPRGPSVRVLRLAVAPGARRRGVGRRLLARLAARLAPAGPVPIVLDVPERQLAAQRFLRACGFRAVALRRGGDADTGEDLYVFEHRALGAS